MEFKELDIEKKSNMTLEDYINEFKKETSDSIDSDKLKIWIYFKWSKVNNVEPDQDEFYQKMLATEDEQLKKLLLDTHKEITKIIFSGKAEEFLRKYRY